VQEVEPQITLVAVQLLAQCWKW